MATKKFIFDEEKPPIYYREGTSDEWIIRAVLVDRGEYVFPQIEPKMCWDIGANIGVVSVILANIYPKAVIHAFEPVKANFELLLKNIEPYPNVKPHNEGLGAKTKTLQMWPSDNAVNYGGFSHHIESEGETQEVSIRSVIDAVNILGAPDLIKIDVEGAEYEILTSLTYNAVKQLKWVAGELHGVQDFELLDQIQSWGFDIAVAKDFNMKNYHFHARPAQGPDSPRI